MKKAFFGFVVMVFWIMFAVNVLAEPVTLKFGIPDSAQSPVAKVIKDWTAKVMKDSQGTLKIDMYPGGALGRDPRLYYKSLKNGVVDITWMVNDYVPGKFPDDHVFHLPFMAENQLEASLAAQRMLDKGLLRGYEDMVVLCLGTTEPCYIQTNFPVNTPSDLKGHKFRVADKTQATMMVQLGVTPATGISITKVAEALTMGVIDGTICDTMGLFPFRIGDATSHHVKIPTGTITLLYAINKKKYEGLPLKAKQAIDINRGIPMILFLNQRLHELNLQLFDKLKNDPKHTVIIPTGKEREQWKAALMPVVEKWKKDTPNGEKLVQAYQDELELIRAGK